MSKSIKLSSAVKYSSKRINIDEISVEDFISTDNLLQNKLGKENAIKLPSLKGLMPGYSNDNILVGNIRPYLRKIWFSDKESGCSADVLVFEVNKFHYPKFIYYTLFRDDFFDHMMKGSKGTKMPRGDKKQILDFLIPDFEFEEQQKIAKVLADLDAKIELNNRINCELESMAKTLYDYWFVQFDFPHVTSSGVEKPYKSSGGKMVWNEELKREIPEGWEVKKIKEFAETGSGGTPLKSKKEYFENGTIPWINSGEVNASFIISSRKFITQKGLDNSSAKLFKKGTILMAMYGATAGQVSLIDLEASTNQAVCGIIPHDNRMIPYLKYGLHQLYDYLINLSSGSARDNLSQDKIKELYFVIPKEKLLDKFYKISNSHFEMILKNLKENQELASLRDWLLPMLMNGQVSVGDVAEELGMVAEDNASYGK
jgi:type I restriction enzyme S subunit